MLKALVLNRNPKSLSLRRFDGIYAYRLLTFEQRLIDDIREAIIFKDFISDVRFVKTHAKVRSAASTAGCSDSDRRIIFPAFYQLLYLLPRNLANFKHALLPYAYAVLIQKLK